MAPRRDTVPLMHDVDDVASMPTSVSGSSTLAYEDGSEEKSVTDTLRRRRRRREPSFRGSSIGSTAAQLTISLALLTGVLSLIAIILGTVAFTQIRTSLQKVMQQTQQQHDHHHNHYNNISSLQPSSSESASVLTIPSAATGHETTTNVLSPTGKILTCGDTVDEAKSRGCKYDILLVAWMPPACYSPTFALEGIQTNTSLAKAGGAGNWTIYRDREFQHPVSYEVMSTIDQDKYWATFDFHRAHCLHMWYLMSEGVGKVRDGEKDVWVFTSALALEHVRHCSEVVLDRERKWDAPSHVVAGFGTCSLLGDLSGLSR